MSAVLSRVEPGVAGPLLHQFATGDPAQGRGAALAGEEVSPRHFAALSYPLGCESYWLTYCRIRRQGLSSKVRFGSRGTFYDSGAGLTIVLSRYREIATAMIRKLTLTDVEEAYAILLEVTAWLKAKGIPQWETPLPKPVYTRWLAQGLCYGYVVDDRVAAVFTIRQSDLSEWDVSTAAPVNWLSTMAVSRSFSDQGIGSLMLSWIRHQIDTPIFLDCVDHHGFLPQFYRSHGFREVKRKNLYGHPMVLMECLPSLVAPHHSV